jgi:hypothetical protein
MNKRKIKIRLRRGKERKRNGEEGKLNALRWYLGSMVVKRIIMVIEEERRFGCVIKAIRSVLPVSFPRYKG